MLLLRSGANLSVAMWRVSVLTIVALGLTTAGLVNAASQDSGSVVAVTVGKPSEFAFTLSRSRVPLGTAVFNVTNRGRIPHQFTVCKTAVASATRNSCRGIGTRILSPGQSATLTVDFVKPGSYEYVSRIACEADRGMKGTLVVETVPPV
jgi:plastocyanin